KMNTPKDLHAWSEERFFKESAIKSELKGTQDKLDYWIYEIQKNISNLQDKNLWKYIIFNAIKKTDIYAPEFNPQIIRETIQEITSNIEKKPDRFNFRKIYEKNLKNHTLDKYFPDKNKNGWIKFSKPADSSRNDEIISDIRNLSIGTKWCTKSKLFAQECIDLGDFYILFKDGKSVLGLRTQNNKIYEIKNKMNKPDYKSLQGEIDELLEQYPKLKKYNDNISIWDLF
ncbi:MAG: hypothetical protein NC191_07285, partial [Muribaculaceae bacterium]|nr:hypothetical protein [Muribaculaceae bacterium]